MGFISRSVRIGFLCGMAVAGFNAGGCASTNTEQARAEFEQTIRANIEVRERLRRAQALSLAREARELAPIYFDYGQYRIRDDQKPVLHQHAERLKADLDFGLVIEGHCDERGTDRFNVVLGQKRADSTRDFIVQAGVSLARLTTVSFGSGRLVAKGQKESAWAQNRRVEFVRVATKAF